MDSGETLCSAPGHKWSDQRPSRSVRLHQQWRSAIGDAAVASLPIFCDGHCVAVLSLVRPGQAGFPPGELAEVERLAGAYGPAVQLVARAGRSWLTLTRDNLREGCGWLLARNRWGRKLVAAAAILLVAWFCWGNIDYRVTMPCRLVPTRIHHFAAPFEGIVRSAHVEVGDRVTAGQLLYTLDTRDWEFRQRELQTEAAVLELEIAQATGTGELEQAALARARREVVLARLMGVQRRIGLAEVRAHRDGTIVAGDIAKMVGDVVPLGAPLLECAPNESLMVELRVRGKDAATIRPGQPGTFATIARPGARLACVVDRVEPAASVVDGEHVYLARAKLIQPPPQVPLGIDGVAVVEAGRRRVWWVALHRAIDYLRLNFWI